MKSIIRCRSAAVIAIPGAAITRAAGCTAPRDAEPNPRQFLDVLDSVAWAPDPGDDSTRPIVGDWAEN